MTKRLSKYKVKECKHCTYCEPDNETYSICRVTGDIQYVRHPYRCKEGEPKENYNL